jgi:hypothetical protein
MRKLVAYVLGVLLIAIPLLGSLAQEASAASSRVAVIKELKGTVKVKKSGGAKEFTAFAKMSLNEGDVLAVGADSSAVLQFANGASEDDQMTAGANTTLTFSKLSDSKGTTTKVSMLSGSVWSTVKSIKNKEDQFTLDTPTAIMGVRGTNLYVSVDPATGNARFMIASGVGQIMPKNDAQPPIDVFLYPNQQVTIDDRDRTDEFPDEVIVLDIEDLISGLSPRVIEAMIESKERIDRENQELLNKIKQQLTAGEGLPSLGVQNEKDLDRLMNNLDFVIAGIIKAAIQKGVVDKAEIEKKVEEANRDLTKKIDLDKNAQQQLTDAEKQKQEQMKKLQQEKSAQALKEKQEALQRQQADLLKQLEETRKKQAEANKKALEEAKKKAKEAYESKLSELEKKRFEEDSKKRNEELKNQSPSPSPTTGGGGGGSNSGPNTPPTGETAPFGLYFNSVGSNSPVQKTFVYTSAQSNYAFSVKDDVDFSLIKRNEVSGKEVVSVKYKTTSENGEDEMSEYDNVYFHEGYGGYLVPLTAGTTHIVIQAVSLQPGMQSIGSGEGSGQGSYTYELTVDKAASPEGLTAWGVWVPLDETEMFWKITGTDKYAMDLNEWYPDVAVAALDLSLEFAANITKAELSYTPANAQAPRTVTWTSSGSQTITELQEGFNKLTLKLYSGSILKSTKELWIANGFSEVDEYNPFDIKTGQGITVAYQNRYEENYSELIAYVGEEVSRISIEAKPSSMLRIQTVREDGQSFSGSNGKFDIDLGAENTVLNVTAKNVAGLGEEYDYSLLIVRVPTGINSWKVTEEDWEQAPQRASTPRRYYFDVYSGTNSVRLEVEQAAGNLFQLTRNGQPVTPDSNGDYMLDNLLAGINLYEFSITSGTATTNYELIVEKYGDSQASLLRIDGYAENDPDNDAQNVTITTIMSQAYLTVGTDPRFVKLEQNGVVIAAEGDRFPLELQEGANAYVVTITHPVTKEEEVIQLTIVKFYGPV